MRPGKRERQRKQSLERLIGAGQAKPNQIAEYRTLMAELSGAKSPKSPAGRSRKIQETKKELGAKLTPLMIKKHTASGLEKILVDQAIRRSHTRDEAIEIARELIGRDAPFNRPIKKDILEEKIYVSEKRWSKN